MHQLREGETGGDPAVLGVEGRKVLFPFHVSRAFGRAFSRSPPAIVHVHESDGALLVLAVRAARALGRPLGRTRIVATLQVSYREERWAVRPIRDGVRVVSRPTFGEWVFAWLRDQQANGTRLVYSHDAEQWATFGPTL